MCFENRLQQWWTNSPGRENRDTPCDRNKMGIRIYCQVRTVTMFTRLVIYPMPGTFILQTWENNISCSVFFIYWIRNNTPVVNECWRINTKLFRSSHLEVFCKIFAKFTGIHLYWGPFLGQRFATLLKRNFITDVSLWICRIFKNVFSLEYSGLSLIQLPLIRTSP